MAALVAARTEINVKRTTTATTVPDDPIAKLMYYLNCVFSCVDIGNDPSLNRLRNYSNYTSLSTDEKAQVLALCLALSPDKLTGVIFFRNETLQSRFTNDFFELSAVNTKLVVADSLLVGGQQKRVCKIMMFKGRWMEKHFIEPLREISGYGQPSPQGYKLQLVPQSYRQPPPQGYRQQNYRQPSPWGYGAPPYQGYPPTSHRPTQPVIQQKTQQTIVVASQPAAVPTRVVNRTGTNHLLHFIIFLVCPLWLVCWICACFINSIEQ